MEEILIKFLLNLGVKQLKTRIERDFDNIGNAVYKIVHLFDSNGDGELDSKETLLEFSNYFPDLSDGMCLCNDSDGDFVYGIPQFKIVDGTEITDLINDSSDVVYSPDGIICDYDGGDGSDDVLIPFPDYTGDGVNDYGLIVDDDNNGVPDVDDRFSYYPIGSDEYNEIIYKESTTEYFTIMDKPLAKYTVTEGLLLLFAVFGAFGFLRKIFRRRKVVNNGLG